VLGTKGPSAALVAIDPRDGRVLAMYGGKSFKDSQFNLAVQGERQSGSAFKPFVLAAALQAGISPQTTFTSRPTTINLGDKVWSIANYEGSYLGPINLYDATTHSDNTVFAQLTSVVGPGKVAKEAHDLGVTSPLNAYFAIGLGVEAVNPLEMARAFSTFANNGARIDGSILGNRPRAVLKVQDGKRTIDNAPRKDQVLDPGTDALLTSMLQNVVREGTGQKAALADRPVAGKTGTTENYGDAWFVGYTPQLAVAVWVGYPNKLIPMEHEFEGGPVAGGTFPALIWKSFAEKALRYMGAEPESFPAPSYPSGSDVQVAYRGGKWLLDNGNCKFTRNIVYFNGFAPAKTADCKPNEVPVPRVVGLRDSEAQARIAAMPLTPEVVMRPAKPGDKVGIVVAQFPAGGTLSSYDTVRIVVSKSRHGVVPRVVGLQLDQARKLLARRGFVPRIEMVSGEQGVVLVQTPKSGTAGKRDLVVTLRVGRG